jgi:hypothetical protein
MSGERIVKGLIEDTTEASDEEAERILEGVSTALLTIRDLELVGECVVQDHRRGGAERGGEIPEHRGHPCRGGMA